MNQTIFKIVKILLDIRRKKERPSWIKFGLLLAYCTSLRSQDPYTKVGAVALRKDNSVAGVGYNGPPQSIEIDWTNREEKNKRVIHAEMNCLKFCTLVKWKLLF